MNVSVPAGDGCGVFGGVTGSLEPATAIHRFVVGEDSEPSPMDSDEANRELGDPFATLLLVKGKRPSTAAEVVDQLRDAAPDGDPLGEHRTFFLGEGSKIAVTPDTGSVRRGLRFVVTTGSPGAEGPDIMISVFHPDAGDVELMAWDRVNGGFNYYRTVGDAGTWVWAGNSRHAVAEATEGKGVFQAHPSGSFLMKELKIPWVHWESFKSNVDPNVFADGDDRAGHPWFTEREGAEICETQVAIPSIERWTKVRFEQAVDGGQVARPRRIMEQVLDTPTVNLASSQVASRATGPNGNAELDLPGTFFVDADCLSLEKIGLPAPPSFQISADLYRDSLERFEFTLQDGAGFNRKGDTHFAFVVPERAFEDVATLTAAIDVGLVTPRLAACLLMVDFPNPIFSPRREALLDRVPESATIADGTSGFSEEMANRILAAAETATEGSAEKEFAERWAVGDEWPRLFGDELQAYYEAVGDRLRSADGFDGYVQLAESRRRQVDERFPIVELELLFPKTNITGDFVMERDGTVTETTGEGG